MAEGGKGKKECMLVAADASLGALFVKKEKNEPARMLQFLSIYTPSSVVVLVDSPKNTETQGALSRIYPEVESCSVSRSEARRTPCEKYLQRIKSEAQEEATCIEKEAICFFLYYLEGKGALKGEECFTIREISDKEIVGLDRWTERSLEIVFSSESKRTENTLFSAVNFAKTASGKEALKRALVSPPSHIESILSRQNAVSFLLGSPELCSELSSIFSTLRDIDGCISGLRRQRREGGRPEKKIKEIMRAKTIICGFCSLKKALRGVDSILLAKARDTVPGHGLERLRRIISASLESNLPGEKEMKRRFCFAISAAGDSVVAMARSVYDSVVADILCYGAELEQRHQLPLRPVLRGKCFVFVSKGVFFEAIKKEKEFLNAAKKQGSVVFTTMALLKHNTRLAQAEAEVYLASEEKVSLLCEEIGGELNLFYGMSEVVGLVDMLCSFCEYARKNEAVQPVFSKSIVSLEEARCPVLGSRAEPSDYFIQHGNRQQIVTGKNMSGKSVYLKQLARLCLMSYAGMRIPCKNAVLCVFDRICTRCGADDDLAGNSSTFFVEMKEMAFVLGHATERSLVLLDELGRGTGTADAVHLSVSICEELLRRKAFVLFATHSLETAGLLQRYPGVCRVQIKGTYLGAVEGGACYGLEAAQKLGFPEAVLSRARSVSLLLRKSGGQEAEAASGLKDKYEKAMLMKKMVEEAALSDQALCSALNRIKGSALLENEAA